MAKACWKIIRTREEYDFAMNKLLELAEQDLDNDADLLDEFELISLLVGDYESKEFPIDKPSAIEAIKFRMDQQGLTQKDMQDYLGSKSKVSEVLAGKVSLSMTMIRKVHEGLGIPLDILIQSTETADTQNSEINDIDKLAETLGSFIDAGVAYELNLPFMSEVYNKVHMHRKPLIHNQVALAPQYFKAQYDKYTIHEVASGMFRAAITTAVLMEDDLTSNNNEFSKINYENTITFENCSPSIH